MQTITKKLSFREQRKIEQRKMYADYLKAIEENAAINKSQLKRELAEQYGYTSETSVNTIIWKIEKENKNEN